MTWAVLAGLSVLKVLVSVTGLPASVAVAVTVYLVATFRAQVLCQVVPAAFRVPLTGSVLAWTETFVILPWAEVTVIPRPGLTFWLPLAGLIASPDGAGAWACLPCEWPATRPGELGELAEQAVARSPARAKIVSVASRLRLAGDAPPAVGAVLGGGVVTGPPGDRACPPRLCGPGDADD
jgi:hypothetical protein